jgi:steroid 5-alpha reductase family enzyme
MKFNPKGLLVTVAFIALLVVAIATKTGGALDNLYSIGIGVVLLVSSVVIIAARIRGLKNRHP